MASWPDSAPPRAAFTAAERRVIDRLTTPAAVQAYLNRLAYNTEPPPGGPMQRTFRSVIATRTAHCLEAALTAAVILEQHGYPPTVMSLESEDGLDHVIFVYQTRTGWGSVARSRDPGLHGRRPVFRSLRQMALSYFEPFIDTTGRVKAYGMVDLRVLGRYDWRVSPGNVWKVERLLFEIPHRAIRSSDARVDRLRRRYFAFRRAHPGVKPVAYYDRRTWTEIPVALRPGRVSR
ncbi:MAG: hypothetical protein NUW22_11435 [Acidobacteria bacterium]|nr:hypothetical protein [Acidobacteriota bacterium]